MTTASVPNTFQNAVTATGLQLDQNYNTLVAYLNEPLNRNNYGTDSGTTNTLVLTFAPPVAAYSAGLEITFKAAATNSGACVINADGLGNQSLLLPGGTTLTAGHILAGGVYQAAYDGTNFVYIGPPALAATKAVMQTATSGITFVSPSQMQNHPGVAKAAASWNGTNTGTISPPYAYNVASVVRSGAGTYIVNLTTAMTTSVYAAQVTLGAASTGTVAILVMGAKTVTSVQFTTIARDLATAIDVTDINFTAYGTQ